MSVRGALQGESLSFDTESQDEVQDEPSPGTQKMWRGKGLS